MGTLTAELQFVKNLKIVKTFPGFLKRKIIFFDTLEMYVLQSLEYFRTETLMKDTVNTVSYIYVYTIRLLCPKLVCYFGHFSENQQNIHIKIVDFSR